MCTNPCSYSDKLHLSLYTQEIYPSLSLFLDEMVMVRCAQVICIHYCTTGTVLLCIMHQLTVDHTNVSSCYPLSPTVWQWSLMSPHVWLTPMIYKHHHLFLQISLSDFAVSTWQHQCMHSYKHFLRQMASQKKNSLPNNHSPNKDKEILRIIIQSAI